MGGRLSAYISLAPRKLQPHQSLEE